MPNPTEPREVLRSQKKGLTWTCNWPLVLSVKNQPRTADAHSITNVHRCEPFVPGTRRRRPHLQAPCELLCAPTIRTFAPQKRDLPRRSSARERWRWRRSSSASSLLSLLSCLHTSRASAAFSPSLAHPSSCVARANGLAATRRAPSCACSRSLSTSSASSWTSSPTLA